MECVICLDDISCNDHCNFNCCNNSAHILCLNSWIIKNIDNKNIHKCFICNQDNNAIKNIISLYSYNSDEIINSNPNYIIIDLSANNSQIQHHIEIKSFLLLKLICTTFTISILFIGFLYISPYNKN
jgi:hypothetical protein